MNKLEMATTPKICRECKFCEPDRDWDPARFNWLLWIPVAGWIVYGVIRLVEHDFDENMYRFAKCGKTACEAPVVIDSVTGKKSKKYVTKKYCSTMRNNFYDIGDCGPDGNWFEPKE